MTRLRSRTRPTLARHDSAIPRGARLLLTAGLALGLFAVAMLMRSDAPVRTAEARANTAASPATTYGTLPLRFTPNAGQTDERAR